MTTRALRLLPLIAAGLLAACGQSNESELKQWMGAHNAAIMAVMCLVLGAKLVGDGISGLA